MTNNVQVTASFGAGSEGNALFVATGTLMSDSFVAIVTPVVECNLDVNGNMITMLPTTTLTGALLLASDNFSTGELNWNVFMTVRGLNQVIARDFPVNFSNGATQNLFTILEAAGWTPTPS
jgi:hypothetical protein